MYKAARASPGLHEEIAGGSPREAPNRLPGHSIRRRAPKDSAAGNILAQQRPQPAVQETP